MSIIRVKFDNTLKQSDIIIPIAYSSKQEVGDAYKRNQVEKQQTLVYGIQAPLIMVNNIVVDFPDVISFELTCDKITPDVHIVFHDRYNLTTSLDTPSLDNELRIQILPKFEDKYKKINLTFFITQMKINNGIISITGEYKVPKFTSSNIKSFGEISSYKLFETVAQETGLGFATNVEDTNDTRYRYCDNKSYKDLLKDEVARSSKECVYDYWIDWWNNIVFADIYERYNAVDKDEDMQIWTANMNDEVGEGSEITPMKIVANFHNNPNLSTTELAVSDYKICTSPGSQLYRGTDRVFSIYELNRTEYMDYLVQDGDSKKDVFIKYEYLGECYGDENYLLSSKKYDTFKQKINTNEIIEISLKTPLLGVMRGNRVNFSWYINDSKFTNIQNVLSEADAIGVNPETNIPLPNENSGSTDGSFELDKSVSGQYLVTKCVMKYKDNRWNYVVTLARPSSAKPNIVNTNNE